MGVAPNDGVLWKAYMPVLLKQHVSVTAYKRVPRKEAVHLVKQGLLSRRRPIRQVVRQRRIVDLRLDGRPSEETLDF
jgi:hypothetical protein